ncbi:MAG TPA: ABC-2 family transporter protein [bacterium]|nr:ABC-2 family transporter protein [bacterium]
MRTELDRSGAGHWRAYVSVFKSAFSAHLAYVAWLWVSLAATAVGFALTLLVWTFVRGGMAKDPPLFAYLTLAFMANFTLNMGAERYIGERIREGLVATDLLKPVDYVWMSFFQAITDSVFQGLFTLVIFALAYTQLGAALVPASPLALAQGLCSLGLAAVVQFHLSFLFTQLIFYTHNNYGPYATRISLHQVFSGVFAPLDLYPGLMGTLAAWLPFRHVIYTPCAIWLGRLSGDQAWSALGAQALWALGLMLAGRAIFGSIRRHLTIQGG